MLHLAEYLILKDWASEDGFYRRALSSLWSFSEKQVCDKFDLTELFSSNIRSWVETSKGPNEEMIPWVGWLRPISANNQIWLNSWPELEI